MVLLPSSNVTITIMVSATKKATIGDKTIGKITLLNKPDHLIALQLPFTNTPPISEPIKACDELEGIPSHQVIRFQLIADNKAAASKVCVMKLESNKPLVIVLATPVLKYAPIKLNIAAIIIA